MATMAQIIRGHKRGLLGVQVDDTVYTALEKMAHHDVGAVAVFKGEAVAGLFTERDYARKVILHDRSSRGAVVGDLMSPAMLVELDVSLQDAMAMMASGSPRVRYLVVVDGTRPVGIVSMGDLVKAQMSEQEDAIHALERYITG